MRCPICGTRNKTDALECVACGSALNPVSDNPQKNAKEGTSSGKNASKKTGAQTLPPSKQAEASAGETKEKIYEDGLIPVVIINAREKSHIPMNIDYSLESEKFLEDEEETEDEEEEGLFGGRKKKKAVKPLISGSDTFIYVCMGVLGFLLVFAISYLAINIVLKDMEKRPPSSTDVASNESTPSSSEGESDASEPQPSSSQEEESLHTGEAWLWEERAWIRIIDSEAHLVQYIGDERIVRIQSEYDGYPLTTIDSGAFQNCESIQALEIPEGVIEMGDYVLAGCTNLRVIALPESLVSMGEHALDGVEELSIISPGGSYGFQLGLLDNYHWIWGNGLPQDVSQWVEEENPSQEETPPQTDPIETQPPQTDPIETQPPQTDPIETQPPETAPPQTEPNPPVIADGTYYEPDIIYRVIGGEVTIVKYRGAGGVVSIPSEYNGCPVRYIGDAAFQGSTNVTHIIVPESVVSIGYHGMSDMIGCVMVTIPSTVTSIDDSAFEDSGEVIIKSPAGSFAESYCKSHPPLVWQDGYGL